MPIRNFRITKQKALILAECDQLPAIMVIAGPNGVGKSTLLYALKKHRGKVDASGKVLYIPPHRVWRKSVIRYNSLLSETQKLADILTQDQTTNTGGTSYDRTRAPDTVDEAMTLVRRNLAQFQLRKVFVQDRILQSRGQVTLQDIGDIYAPVRDLTKYLLPHLEFSRIDAPQQKEIRFLFERTDQAQTVEIDLEDLSSGERSLISLFAPFLEAQIDQRLSALENNQPITSSSTYEDMVVLIDEPELHLEPLLQARLLNYLRVLTSSGSVQFILATQSSVLLNAANSDELYVLTPPTQDPEYNQLVRLADSDSRLQAMRELSGDTYVLTACRSIICVEGELPSSEIKEPTDVRVLELLWPEITSHHVLIPFGSKGEAIRAKDQTQGLIIF